MEQIGNSEEVKKVQQIALSLYKKFADICDANNLTFYFTGGALIGVKRHQGFIPWDDDIDIVMPRKDFDRFQEIAGDYASEGYGVCNRWTDPNWHFAFLQFMDMRSEIEINLAEIPRRSSVWLDVYPIDGVPSGKIRRKLYVRYILFQRYKIQAAHIRTQSDSIRKRALYERIIISVLKKLPMDKLINTNKVIDRMENKLRKYDMSKCEYSGNLLGRYREREIVPTKYWGVPNKEPFEECMVSTPHDGDAILRMIYGNYMKMPSKDMQVAHQVRVIRIRE